jgi:hypothetical protein
MTAEGTRTRRLAAGLCGRCGLEAPVPGVTLCRACRQVKATAARVHRARREARRAAKPATSSPADVGCEAYVDARLSIWFGNLVHGVPLWSPAVEQAVDAARHPKPHSQKSEPYGCDRP